MMQIAVETGPDPFVLPASADLVYLGERFCVARFLEHSELVMDRAEEIRTHGKEAFLSLPSYITESEWPVIIKTVEPLLDHVDGILSSDIAILRRFRDRTRLRYFGPCFNQENYNLLWEDVGVEGIRVFPPTLPLLEQIENRGELILEIQAFGHIPFGATPRCLIRIWKSCEECGIPLRLLHQDGEMIVDGNTYRTAPITSCHLDYARLRSIDIGSLVVETFGLDEDDLDRAIEDLRAARPPSGHFGEMCNGLYRGHSEVTTETGIWCRWYDRTE